MTKRTCPICGVNNYSAAAETHWLCCECGQAIPRKSCMICKAHPAVCEICKDYSEFKE